MTKPIDTVVNDSNTTPELGKTKFVMTEKTVSITKELLIAVLLNKFGNKVPDGRSVNIDIGEFIKVANEYEYPISINMTPDLKRITISAKVCS